jgi:hypothetical protein
MLMAEVAMPRLVTLGGAAGMDVAVWTAVEVLVRGTAGPMEEAALGIEVPGAGAAVVEIPGTRVVAVAGGGTGVGVVTMGGVVGVVTDVGVVIWVVGVGVGVGVVIGIVVGVRDGATVVAAFTSVASSIFGGRHTRTGLTLLELGMFVGSGTDCLQQLDCELIIRLATTRMTAVG